MKRIFKRIEKAVQIIGGYFLVLVCFFGSYLFYLDSKVEINFIKNGIGAFIALIGGIIVFIAHTKWVRKNI